MCEAISVNHVSPKKKAIQNSKYVFNQVHFALQAFNMLFLFLFF